MHLNIHDEFTELSTRRLLSRGCSCWNVDARDQMKHLGPRCHNPHLDGQHVQDPQTFTAVCNSHASTWRFSKITPGNPHLTWPYPIWQPSTTPWHHGSSQLQRGLQRFSPAPRPGPGYPTAGAQGSTTTGGTQTIWGNTGGCASAEESAASQRETWWFNRHMVFFLNDTCHICNSMIIQAGNAKSTVWFRWQLQRDCFILAFVLP